MHHHSSEPIGGTHASAGQDAVLLAARVLLGAIFLMSGFGKLAHLGGFIDNMGDSGVPLAAVTAPLGACVEFFGGLALVLGAWTSLAAVAVAAFTLAATLVAHRFWQAAADQQMMQQINFMKNLAIIGGMLALAAIGGGRFGVDGWRRRGVSAK